MSTPVQTAGPVVATPWAETLRVLVDGARSRGAYSIGEIATSPGWCRPTYVHHLAAETFYAAVGDVSVVIDGERLLLAAGSAVHVPRGAARSLTRLGPGDGRLLVVQTPGGLLEQPADPSTAASCGLELVDPA